ncbi:16S rRNA (cytosine(1402)-N(4))-methyltransferase RsmH [Mangrovicoccus algicola]|uniref:Ribosomal RNA small subunit methyltransferase H n=1 Tax=Mangrovicoccus algicola TaxID=2771008 RepID=A0A8J6Z006_9RHOB|nr:16S rRNA (cytosine(1402)-N(4))-methyltransferase RsmH [Mangrovicoccus algicola]
MSEAPHVPVLIGKIIEAASPVRGRWLDGTLGAGGYARALLEAGAEHVTGVDRDPLALQLAAEWGRPYGERLGLYHGTFSTLDRATDRPLDGVTLDLGVSSMQLDLAERGFSFLRDGPLDMRMSQEGVSAADLVNRASEEVLADILYHYGEERASRRIARAIGKARAEAPVETTGQLVKIVESCLPRPKPGQSHPATRSFQALRIAVNDEFGQLIEGLEAAERVLAPGGWLAVVTFHSMEDRVVKRFIQARAARSGGGGSRYAPAQEVQEAVLTPSPNRAIAPDPEEIDSNPRARSAKLRLARRTDAALWPLDRAQLGLPRRILPEDFS